MRQITLMLITLVMLAGCNFNATETTPTVEGIEVPVNPLPEATTPSPAPSLTPSPTLTPPDVAQVITQIPTLTFTPTETLIPTETPGPWEYVIQPGDTLFGIIQLPPFNYPYDPAVAEAVVRINPNMPNADSLPPPGTTILIPRPTPTPAPEGLELTQVVAATRGVPTRGLVGLQPGVEIGLHTVREGESAVGIVAQYGGLTLEIFSQLNAHISFLGCDFNEPSGGPNCNPLIVAGQDVNIPLPTPTITPSPTPSGSETPTTTPTFRAPSIISPPEGSTVSGELTLYWDSAGILKQGQNYLVQVTDLTANTFNAYVTQNTLYRLPEDLIPTDGQVHDMQWNVIVASANAEGAFASIGDPGQMSTFRWQSR